jgi:hypothetical protein
LRVSMAGGRIPACAGKTTYCGGIEMREREASAALAEGKTGE